MEPTEFSLDVRLVATEPAVTEVATEECTSDNCGATPGSAGIADC